MSYIRTSEIVSSVKNKKLKYVVLISILFLTLLSLKPAKPIVYQSIWQISDFLCTSGDGFEMPF